MTVSGTYWTNEPRRVDAMRLSAAQAQVVREEVANLFGLEAEVRLFGSRADDQARGGDIDLLVSLPEPCRDGRHRALRLVARLQRRLGDQRIDVLVTDPETPKQPVHRNALCEGVRL